MIENIFFWFYCLPIWKSVLIISLISGVFLIVNGKVNTCRYKNAAFISLIFISIFFILSKTVFTRNHEQLSSLSLIPFESYLKVTGGANKELLRQNYMNVLLFYPLGLVSGLLSSKKYQKVLWLFSFFILSVLIELVQYKFCLGYSEIDDVIHNTLGVLTGIMVSYLDVKRFYFKNLFRRK